MTKNTKVKPEAKKLDIKNTKEALILGFALTKAIRASKENDGKIGMDDLGNLMLVFPKIAPAIDDAGLIVSELKDLDSEEAKDLMVFASSQLGGALSDEELVVKIETSLKAVIAIFEAVKAW